MLELFISRPYIKTYPDMTLLTTQQTDQQLNEMLTKSY
jgi:hypothetical protein